MNVAIAGGHGTIAMHLTRLLAGRGDDVRSLIRNPDHAEDVRAAGAEPVVCDLESAPVDEVAAAIGRADAVVFAAGAGPGSGAARKETMDHGGAVRLIEAARANHVGHYVMVSAIGADASVEGDEVFDVYLRAKGRADDDLRASGLGHTIVRPTSLTDEPGTGRVAAAPDADGGPVSRQDVAAVLAAVLARPEPLGRTFALTAGDMPVEDAIARLAVTPAG
jgi:uncharacterized protein YbjT (DUF2867 family)